MVNQYTPGRGMSYCAHVQSLTGSPGILDTVRGSSFFPVSRLMTGFMNGVWATRTE